MPDYTTTSEGGSMAEYVKPVAVFACARCMNQTLTSVRHITAKAGKTFAKAGNIFAIAVLCAFLSAAASAQELMPATSAGWSGFSPRPPGRGCRHQLLCA